jgi:hypothetical protein
MPDRALQTRPTVTPTGPALGADIGWIDLRQQIDDDARLVMHRTQICGDRPF